MTMNNIKVLSSSRSTGNRQSESFEGIKGKCCVSQYPSGAGCSKDGCANHWLRNIETLTFLW